MKNTTATWIPIGVIAVLIPLVTLSIAGCDTEAAREQHWGATSASSGHDHEGATEDGHDTSGACSGHDHAHEDAGGHEAHETEPHGSDARESEGGHDAEGYEGHGHGDHTDEVTLRLSERDRRDAGIELATAGQGHLSVSTHLLGEVCVNEERLAHVVPPVPGVVREVTTRVGDEVRAGELLAVLASRELAEARSQYLGARGRRELAQIAHEREQELWEKGLLAEQDHLDARQALLEADIEFRAAEQTLHALGVTEDELADLSEGHEAGALTRYELRAPISGTVIDLHLVLGETVGEDSDVLTLADLSTVWIDLDVPQADLDAVREGQAMMISASGVDISDAVGVIDFVSPVVDGETRTALARVEIANTGGHWRPGLFVTASVTADEFMAPVMIPKHAVQSIEGETVVFVPHGDAFTSAPVLLGRSNGTHVEIEAGLEAGDRYVAEGAFALKAELVTSGLDPHAGHGH